MRNRYRYRTAYVELNGTHEICALAPCNDKEVFTYKNVDFYPHAIIPTLTKVLNMNYDRVIVDFGIININTLKEFKRDSTATVYNVVFKLGRVILVKHFHSLAPSTLAAS